MANIVQAQNKLKPKSSFKVKDDFNYLVKTSFGDEYIVSSSDARRIITALGSERYQYVSILDEIVAKKHIYKISPTRELTTAQKNNSDELVNFL